MSRPDGGDFKAFNNGTYEAHTLLTWSGLLKEYQDAAGEWHYIDYSTLPDGGPGTTRSTLEGKLFGAWVQKAFPDPNHPGQTYTTFDVDILWSGGATNPSRDHFYPTDPLSVEVTNYSGDMPLFDPAGTGPKTEVWKYHAAEQSGNDRAQCDLMCTWYAHYVAENWTQDGSSDPYLGSPGCPTIGDWLQVYDFSELPTTYNLDHVVTFGPIGTVTEIDQQSIVPFTIRKWHFGIPLFRDNMGCVEHLDLLPPMRCDVTQTDPDWTGPYGVRGEIFANWQKGQLDLHNALGKKARTNAGIVPFNTWGGRLFCRAKRD